MIIQKTPSLDSIFREYDVRGLVAQQLDDSVYFQLGTAFAAYVRERSGKNISCAVGKDNRPSSESYHQAFIKGFVSGGGNVFDVGLATTPAVYFANRFFHTTAAAAITASHNPPEYNGVKFVYGGQSAGGLEVQKIKDFFFQESFAPSVAGVIRKESIASAYESALTASATVKPFKVVVDCGNGVASIFAPSFLKRLGCTVIPLHCDATSPFSTHPPDTVDPANYKDLQKAVGHHRANIGLLFDGDGDRVGAVDEEGTIIWPDQLLILFARDHLKKKPHSKIIVEIKCSQSVYDDILAHDGIPIWSPTGRTRIEEKMKAEGAELAGEMSGHFFFWPKWLSDAFFTSRKLLEILSGKGPLPTLLKDVPKYYSSQEYRVKVSDAQKFELIRQLTSAFKKDYEVVTLDGAKVIFQDGWGLVRASQNEPKLSLRFEGKSPKALQHVQKIFKEHLEVYGVRVPF